MSQTVIGIFKNASDAQDAVEQLVKKGFDRSAIDVSNQSTSGTTGTDYSTTGGIGSDLSATGTSTTGYASTGLGNEDNFGETKVGKFFKSLFGGDNDDTTSYSNYTKAAQGGSVVTVHAQSSDLAEDAADILDDYGAVDVNEGTESSTGYKATGTTASTSDQALGTTTAIPIIEEKLQVGKRTVETGGVRLRSRIVEKPVEESLRLREERVYVDRTSVNRPVTGSELENFKEGTIELTESAEVPVVAKEAYVKEEVKLGKEVNERNETIRDTVRSTEVDVENLDTKNTTGTSYGTSTSTDVTGGTL